VQVYRYGVLLVFAAAVMPTIGCAKLQNSHDVAHPGAKVTPWHVTPLPASTSPPNYLANDYNKPGHPSLTPSEVRLITKTLAVVEPCQIPFLRYAFPENAPGIALYFGGSDTGDYPELWEPNSEYRSDQGLVGAVSATMPGPDLRSTAAIRKLGCHAGLTKYTPK